MTLTINLSQSDKDKLAKIRKYRNKIEHFSIDEPILSIQANIHKGISILISIISIHFDLNNFNDDESYLFHKIIEGLKNLQEHYNDVKTAITKQLDNEGLINETLKCLKCKEKYLLIDEGPTCRLCGYEEDPCIIADEYLWVILGIDSYTSTVNGDTYPLYECPECGAEALIYENERNEFICFHCGVRHNESDTHSCQKCGKILFNSNEVCNDCLDYLHHE